MYQARVALLDSTVRLIALVQIQNSLSFDLQCWIIYFENVQYKQ